MKIRALCLILLVSLPALAQAPAAAPAPAPVAAPAPAPVTAPAPAPVAVPAPPPVEVPGQLRLVFAATPAFGLSNAGFFNQLIGARIDYRFTPRFAFGGTLSYANLKGKSRRVHNVLPEATLEYRFPITGEKFGLPISFAAGFLPKNGPTLRVAVGLDLALSETVTLLVNPLEPMAWVNRERTEVSLNATLALRIAL